MRATYINTLHLTEEEGSAFGRCVTGSTVSGGALVESFSGCLRQKLARPARETLQVMGHSLWDDVQHVPP
jgi:hypothetical protein